MMKNKIIALISVFAMAFSFTTSINAAENTEKTKIIKDPTFFVKEDSSLVSEYGLYMYYLGVNYTYDGADPIDYALTETTFPVPSKKYSGAGFKSVTMYLDVPEEGSEDANIFDSFDTATYGVIGSTMFSDITGMITNTSTDSNLFKPSTIIDEGAVFFTLYSTSPVDTSKIKCTNLTLLIQDYGDTAVASPTVQQSWSYSSDVDMVDAGNADFYAYTGTQTQEPDPEPPVDPEPEEPEVQEPAPGTVVTKDGYTTVVDDDKATRFVVSDTIDSVGPTTATSVLKATYAGTIKQANLWKLLGVETSEEPGEVTIGKLTIKAVLGTDVKETSQVGDFSIAVQK